MGTPGCRRGVIRSYGRTKNIYVNGHRKVPQRTADKIVTYLRNISRPVIAKEVAEEFHYNAYYIADLMHLMTVDGVLRGEAVRGPGASAVYWLPEVDPDCLPGGGSKRCTKCERVLPVAAFPLDRSQPSGRYSRCRQCRSPKTDKSRVTTHVGRG